MTKSRSFILLEKRFYQKQITFKRSTGVTLHVNLRNPLCASEKASQGSTLALKPRADVTRSPKQGFQWPTIGLVSSKNWYNIHKIMLFHLKNLPLHHSTKAACHWCGQKHFHFLSGSIDNTLGAQIFFLFIARVSFTGQLRLTHGNKLSIVDYQFSTILDLWTRMVSN